MRRLLLLVMVFPLLMVSCSRGGKELAAKLHLADSLIEAEPDSGVALLMSLEEEAADASRANRYRYQLLLAKAMNKTYRPITTDSVMRKVADYYDDHGSANDRMEAHYLLGCAYRDMGDLPQALLQYEEAVAKADTASEDCDFKTLWAGGWHLMGVQSAHRPAGVCPPIPAIRPQGQGHGYDYLRLRGHGRCL